MSDAFVYFIRPIGMRGPVKIGCSKNTAQRLMTLALWSPFPLEVAAALQGDFKLEARFHSLFHEHLSHHEWFNACDEIDAAIAAIHDGAFDMGVLPKRGRRSAVRVNSWTPDRRMARGADARIEALKNAGVEVPPAIAEAHQRCYRRIFYRPVGPYDAADVALVRGWLASMAAIRGRQRRLRFQSDQSAA